MTVKVTGTSFDDIVPGLQKALDGALANTLNLQQGALNKDNPVDTGRMASSWRIGFNSRPDADRGEDWQSDVGVKWKFTNKIKFEGEWYISNTVPYAIFTALNYKPSAKAQKDWYTSIANRTGQVFVKEFNKLKP